VFAVGDKEAYLCTYRAARNMAFQGIITPRGEINQLLEIDGSKVVGTKIKAPFAINPEVYVLPMENVLATKVCSAWVDVRVYVDLNCAGHWCSHIRPIRLS
jgi:leucyl-tRNA synthetase